MLQVGTLACLAFAARWVQDECSGGAYMSGIAFLGVRKGVPPF